MRIYATLQVQPIMDPVNGGLQMTAFGRACAMEDDSHLVLDPNDTSRPLEANATAVLTHANPDPNSVKASFATSFRDQLDAPALTPVYWVGDSGLL